MRLLVVLTICLLFQSCARKDALPQNLLEYNLIRKISGSEAVQMVNRLHLQPVTDTENVIGFYEKDTDQAIIYVTHYKSENNAQEDLVKMVEKISPENSVFINGGQIESRNIITYRYFGIGQTHFIFRHEHKLFWLSVDTMIAQDFLDSYIDYLQ